MDILIQLISFIGQLILEIIILIFLAIVVMYAFLFLLSFIPMSASMKKRKEEIRKMYQEKFRKQSRICETEDDYLTPEEWEAKYNEEFKV